MKNIAQNISGQLSAGLALIMGPRVDLPVAILAYHRIAPQRPHLPVPSLNVTPRSFKYQIAGLLAKGFRFAPLRQILECHRAGERIPPRTIVLTFDDGFSSVYHYALPVLRDYQVPATVFVCTAFLGSEKPFPFDRWGRQHQSTVPVQYFRPLTLHQCKEMMQHGLIEIGAHTHSHRDFRGNPAEFAIDLKKCVNYLSTHLRIENATFAFPHGRKYISFVNVDFIREARKTGVQCGLTTECELVDPQSDPFCWGRFNVYNWDTASTLVGKLAGWYSWAPKLQERFLRW